MNKRFKKKDFGEGRVRSHYRNKGEEPGTVSFEDVAPKDIKASYGEKSKEYSPGFEKRAFKDLAFGQVTLKVNPEVEAGESADPYPIIGPTNKVIDAVYYGEDNTSGSVCPQLALGSGSHFYNCADFISEEVFVNYNYAKHVTTDNASAQVNKAYYYPWADIDSSIQSEAFYDLPFFKWVVTGSDTNYDDTLLDIIDYYQTVLQAVYQIPLRYKVLRSLERELKDMCYQRGASILNDIYARLKKKTLVGTIDGISEAMSNHYLDTKWFEETSLLLAQPCRKAKGMLDPLIEVKVKYPFNKTLAVAVNGTPLFATNDASLADLETKVNDTLDKLSIGTILNMARTNANYSTIQTWMNDIVTNVADIKNDLDEFTKDFTDLVVAFKRMSKAGYTNWKVGQFLLLDNIKEDFTPVFNKLVYDIVRTTFTGSRDITYDATINQWKAYSVWDKYLGIPTYDQKAGGAVLTFSTKAVVNSSGLTLAYPAWFKFSSCHIMTRDGTNRSISLENIQVNSGAVARVMGRLIPLTTLDAIYMHCPSLDLSAISSKPIEQSWIVEAMQHVFGYCKVTVAAGTYNYCISDDILTCVDYVINDLNNAIDTMGRINAPFKVLKAVTTPALGLKH